MSAEMDVDAYLDRIGCGGTRPAVDLATLETLMRAHLSTVPFENIDVFNQTPVHTEPELTIDKVVNRRRGGWCFELNGAFAELLEHLGFTVSRLGAAVLLDGPTTVVDHLTLEVGFGSATADRYLVDVGFGDSFCRPLALNRRGPQDGGTDQFEFMNSPEGTTLVRHRTRDDDGPDGAMIPQYRFRRVTLTMADLEPASRRLQDDKDGHWHRHAFATRYIDGGPDRVTLIGNSLKVDRGGERAETEVADARWTEVLDQWFAMTAPLTGGMATSGGHSVD